MTFSEPLRVFWRALQSRPWLLILGKLTSITASLTTSLYALPWEHLNEGHVVFIVGTLLGQSENLVSLAGLFLTRRSGKDVEPTE